LSAISAIGGSVLAVGGAIGLALGGAIGYAFRDSIANFLDTNLPGVSGFLDKILPKFGEAGRQEDFVNSLKDQEAAAGERLRKAQEAKLNGAGTTPGAPAVQNQISISIDKNGRTIVDSGKSDTQVKTQFTPILDR